MFEHVTMQQRRKMEELDVGVSNVVAMVEGEKRNDPCPALPNHKHYCPQLDECIQWGFGVMSHLNTHPSPKF